MHISYLFNCQAYIVYQDDTLQLSERLQLIDNCPCHTCIKQPVCGDDDLCYDCDKAFNDVIKKNYIDSIKRYKRKMWGNK